MLLLSKPLALEACLSVHIKVMHLVPNSQDSEQLRWAIEALGFADPSLEGGRLSGIESCKLERS